MPSMGNTRGKDRPAARATGHQGADCLSCSVEVLVSATFASYPALTTAATRRSGGNPASKRTCARSVARLTSACLTPGTPFSAFSTRPTHDAQVIPPINSSTDSSAIAYPAFSTAAAKAGTGTVEAATTEARSVAIFTVTSRTPGTALRAFSTRKTQEPQVMPSIGRFRCAIDSEADGPASWAEVFIAISMWCSTPALTGRVRTFRVDTMGDASEPALLVWISIWPLDLAPVANRRLKATWRL